MTLAVGLRRVSTGLLIYGAVGLLVAALGLVALLWVGGRIGALSDRTTSQVEALVETLDSSAVALADAGSTSSSFSGTLERTPPTVRQAAQTVANLEANLRVTSQQLAGISILGTQPLGQVSSLFERMADDMDGLDTRLEGVATDLDGNSQALVANAESLEELGTRLDGIAEDLREGFVEDSFADVQAVLTVLALALVAWTAVPAIGALAFGQWLRRELERSTAAAPV